MSTQGKMSIDSIGERLGIKQSHQAKASRKERNIMLNEIVSITGLNRKYVTQLLAGDLKRKPRQRQRGRTYGPDVEAALLVVAESLDFITGLEVPILRTVPTRIAKRDRRLGQRFVALYNRLQHGSLTSLDWLS